ncbi:hypothetical protein HID58_006787, partial [Brassica napus]
WQKPPSSFVKCNVGSSWDESSKIEGGACIVRDEKVGCSSHVRPQALKCNYGVLVFRSQKIYGAFTCVLRRLSKLFLNLRYIRYIPFLNFVPVSCNNLANMITRDHKHQSYVALHGPVWLASLIRQEALA